MVTKGKERREGTDAGNRNDVVTQTRPGRTRIGKQSCVPPS